MPYSYERSTDGTEETFSILKPDGSHLVSVFFWYAEAEAEADAKLITEALNAYTVSRQQGRGRKDSKRIK